MKLAFVFPGQGSQTVGMMDGFAAHPAVRATFDEASAALGEDLWKLVADGPDTELNRTVNTQPVMLTAGVAVWRAWQAAGGPDAVGRRRPLAGRVHGAGRRRRARVRRRAAAGSLPRAGDAGRRAGRAGRDGGGDRRRGRRGGRRLRRGGAGAGGRAGQLQRPRPAGDRRRTGRRSSGRSWRRRRGAPSARCCCRCRRRSTRRC